MTTILTAVITGVAVLLAGNLPWAGFGPIVGLGRLNLQFWTAVPWAILPMAVYLWAYWRFIGGAWGAGAGAGERRANLRASRHTSKGRAPVCSGMYYKMTFHISDTAIGM